jgi:hypothetical protein
MRERDRARAERKGPDKLTKLDPPHLKQRVMVAGGVGLSILGGIGGGFEMWSSGISISNDFMDLRSNRKPSLVAYASLANNSTRFAAGAISIAESATAGLLMSGVGSSSTVMTHVIPGVGLVVKRATGARHSAAHSICQTMNQTDQPMTSLSLSQSLA